MTSKPLWCLIARLITVITLSVAWMRVLVYESGFPAMVFSQPLPLALLSVTVLLIFYKWKKSIELSWLEKAIAIVPLSTLVFVAWGTMLIKMPLIFLSPEWPSTMKQASLFYAAPATSLLIVLVLSAPIIVLLGRLHWIPVAFAAMAIFPLQHDVILSGESRMFLRALLVYEIATLCLFTPMLVEVVRRKGSPLLRRLANQHIQPTLLRRTANVRR